MDKKIIKEIIIYACIILFVVLLRTFIVTPVVVSGASMEPTLKDDELMFLNKISYTFGQIKRYDIVVIKLNDEYIIKRVIGLPGENVEYINNNLYIDGIEQKEKFNHDDTENFKLDKLGYDTLPQDCYFVVGDNRSVSVDSRIFGCFKKDQILGKANFVFYPFSEFGYKK